LTAKDLLVGAAPGEVSDLHRAIEADGGGVLTVYREPYAGKWLMVVALPIELIGPTPYHRNLSDARVHKLGAVVGKPGRFLDPIICARRPQLESGVKFWTTNGHHRLAAMRKLGVKSITALVIPETAAAYRILALITEKAHNLREKALEVVRMYAELERFDHVSEERDVLEFEEPAVNARVLLRSAWSNSWLNCSTRRWVCRRSVRGPCSRWTIWWENWSRG
jgi:ParB family chromosome partitioning protein